MPPVLPKRCPNCGRKCTKTTASYWLCDTATGGCGWTDDPSALQPAEAAQGAEAAQAAEAMSAPESVTS